MAKDERNEIHVIIGSQSVLVKSKDESIDKLVKVVETFIYKMGGDKTDPNALERATG